MGQSDITQLGDAIQAGFSLIWLTTVWLETEVQNLECFDGLNSQHVYDETAGGKLCVC